MEEKASRNVKESGNEEETDVRASESGGGLREPCPQPSYSELRTLVKHWPCAEGGSAIEREGGKAGR